METTEQVQQRRVRRRTSRRSFLVNGAAVGVGTVGAGWLLTDASPVSPGIPGEDVGAAGRRCG